MHARDILDDLIRLGIQEEVDLPFAVQTDNSLSKEEYQNQAIAILRNMQPSVAVVQWNVTRVVSVEEIKEYFYFLEEAEIFSSEIDITHPGSRASLANMQQAIVELADEEIEVDLVGEVHSLAKTAEEVLQELSDMPEEGVATIPLLVHFSDELAALTIDEYERQAIQLLLGKSPSNIIFNWNADDTVDAESIRSWLLIGREAMADDVMLDISYPGADDNLAKIIEVVNVMNDEAEKLGCHVDIVMRAESVLDIVSEPIDGTVHLPYCVRFGDEEDALSEGKFKKRFLRSLRENRVGKAVIQFVTQDKQTEQMLRSLVSDLVSAGVYEIQFDVSYLPSYNTLQALKKMVARLSQAYKLPYRFGFQYVEKVVVNSLMRKLEASVTTFTYAADNQDDDDESSSENSNEVQRVNVCQLRLSHLFLDSTVDFLREPLMARFSAMMEEKGVAFIGIDWDIQFQLSEEKIKYLFENCGVYTIDIDSRNAGSRYSVKNILAVIKQLDTEMPGEWSFDLRMAQHSDRFFNAFHTAKKPQRRKPAIKRADSSLRLSKVSDDSDEESEDSSILHRVDSEPVMLARSTDSEVKVSTISHRSR